MWAGVGYGQGTFSVYRKVSFGPLGAQTLISGASLAMIRRFPFAEYVSALTVSERLIQVRRVSL